jgi:hypothetical protein
MKDSINGNEPIITPRTQRLDLGTRKLRGSDINWSNPYGDQATHFVVALKVLILQTFLVIRKKKWVTCPRQNQLCVYHLLTKEKHK